MIQQPRRVQVLTPDATPACRRSDTEGLYVIPVFEHFVLYAPLHGLIALLNGAAVAHLRSGLQGTGSVSAASLSEITAALAAPARTAPQPRQGELAPVFLGIIATRGCNLACRYCGFAASPPGAANMDGRLAASAVNWYMDLVGRTKQTEAEVHFFGGEPFYAPEVLDISINLARLRAEQIGCEVRFEVATNGVFNEARARWAADRFDTVVLSCDGPPEIQDRNRGHVNGHGSSATVTRTARILAEGTSAFYVRSCITQDTVSRMPELASWFSQEYAPRGVCFEAMQLPTRTEFVNTELEAPDPWDFGRNFVRAARVLAARGVEPVYATADLSKLRVSFCPVGNDGLIVSPNGTVSACYLLKEEWEARGLDLSFGQLDQSGRLSVDDAVLSSVRDLNVWNKPACAACACRWHCAGGCHVNHPPPPVAGCYDGPCIQTRIITLYNLLTALGRSDLVDELLADGGALRKAVCQRSDLLSDMKGPEWCET